MGDLSPHFSASEFACRCGYCRSISPDPRLIAGLEQLRAIINRPIHVNSGYRCVVHNRAEGGSPRSQHLLAKAADIWVALGTLDLMTAEALAQYAERVPAFEAGGIGTYPNRGFIHLDVGPRRRWVL